MSGDGQLQLQKAIYAALEPAVSPAKVYDHVPQNKTYPYVVIGDGDAQEWDTDTEIGQEHVVQIHVYIKDPKGKRAVKVLQQKIYDALHDQSPALEAGAALVLLLFNFHRSGRDSDDPEIYHGVSQFRAITTEA